MDFSITKMPKWFAHIPSPPHWVAWLFYFLAAYVLSIGPVAWLAYHGILPQSQFLEYLYKPLSWLYASSQPCQAILDWYILKVWHVQPGPP